MSNRKTSIRYRILRLVLISVAVAIVALTVTMSAQIIYVSRNDFNTKMESLAVAYTDAVEASASNVRMQIQAAAENEVLNSEKDTAKLKEELAKLASSTSFKDFSIAETSGKTLNDTDISDREYFQEALKGNTYISRPVVRKTDNSTVIMVGTLMTNGKVLYGALSSDALSHGLTASYLGEGGTVYILDKYMEVMASSNHSIVGTAFEYDGELKEGSRELSTSLMSYYLPIDNTDGWGTVVIGNTTEVRMSILQSMIVGCGLGAFLCSLAIFISFKVSRKIVDPIISATKRLELLANGDTSTEVEVFKCGDETEILTTSLESVCSELSKYVHNIVDTTTAMSNGDFSYSEKMDYKGDFERIPNSFEKIHDVLSNLIKNLDSSVSSVTSGSEQIASGSQMLAEGATRQATATDELSTTISNISTGVDDTAKGAGEASSLSTECASLLREQDEAMTRMVAAMSTIEEKSQAISTVIKAIEDIAFQTNILALNASIEAARAGEAGKGFAVVASEVGNLAQKSAQSADSTKELITSTLSAVEDGSKIAQEAADALKHVTELSEKSAKLVEHIATASNEQAEALTQASKGIEDISTVVQTNSATAEESAASCEELSAQAKMLKELVSKLRA